MSIQAESSTSLTLLGRIQIGNDPAAWAEFTDRYGPWIHGWCRKRGLQPADVENITQDVLTKMYVRLPALKYDQSGSLRGYLQTVTRHAWLDWRRTQLHERGTGDSAVLEQLHNIEAGDDLVCHLDDAYEADIAEEAMARVQLRVEKHNWEAFRLRVLEGLSGKEVATRLKMKRKTVYAIQARI